MDTTSGLRVSLTLWLALGGALAVSCGGNSVSDSEEGDGGGSADSSGDNGGSAATGGSSIGGSSMGAAGASAAGGTPQSGSGGAAGSAGEAALCTDNVPSDGSFCDGDLTGTWVATACPLRVSGVVDLSGLGFPSPCSPPAVAGSLRVSGAVTFDGATFWDETITSGESTFELDEGCLTLATKCYEVQRPLRFLGYESVTCVTNETTYGCTCTGTVRQTGGLAFISSDPSTSGSYVTSGERVTLTAFGIDSEYAACVSQGAESLSLSLVSVSKTGAVVDPIGFVKP
jgi:hypothetical protein